MRASIFSKNKFLPQQCLSLVHFFSRALFTLSPFVQCKISGASMLPSFKEGEEVLVQKRWFFCRIHKGSVVIAKDPRNHKLILKRIEQVRDYKYFLIGDNRNESTDSRAFGWIEKTNIIGSVITAK